MLSAPQPQQVNPVNLKYSQLFHACLRCVTLKKRVGSMIRKREGCSVSVFVGTRCVVSRLGNACEKGAKVCCQSVRYFSVGLKWD